MRFARLLFALGVLGACDSQFGDTPATIVVPQPEGKDARIREIADPDSEMKVAHGTPVAVSGAVVVAVDAYDETKDGRSTGTIYIADLGSQEPYSGISLFNPSFVPGNLRVGAGDTLDLRGTYQENTEVPLKFADGTALVQIASPIAYFRYEANTPPPVEIDIEDLETYETGRKWLNMIVTVKNVTVRRDMTSDPASGRNSAGLLDDKPPPEGLERNACTPFPTAPQLVNELMDLKPLEITKDTKLKSLTGIVTFFCNLHIAPRTPADIVKD
ncbi:MAG: hypothetical protein KIT84_26260 [Labilithrix sp.]|nr:hypothetical protein [Labilithrix sp.]MCW5814560.1 hypothetical protein [Labilithrix sp.]